MNEEQKKDAYDMLVLQASTFIKWRNYSKVKVRGLGAFLKFLETTYDVLRVALNMGSLIISLSCKTSRGLDQLWNDYMAGHLNEVAQDYLVADEIKKQLILRTFKLKTTIEEENYSKCKKVLMEVSGEYKCIFFVR